MNNVINESRKLVLIVTHSRKGFIDNMANAIADGVKEVPDVGVLVKSINEVEISDLVSANAISFGSPNYLTYISGELKHLFDDAYYMFHFAEKINKLKGKPAAAFACGKNKGFYIRKLQYKSTILKELERIIFEKLEMRKVVNGIYLKHGVTPGPDSPIPSLTSQQSLLCNQLGKKLAMVL